MKKTTNYTVLSLIFITLISCGGGSSTADPIKEPVPFTPPEQPIQEPKQLVDSWVAEKIETLNDINCSESVNPSDECELVTVRFSDYNFVSTKTDDQQTILVIDVSMEFSALIRYRSRIKAALQLNDDGVYVINDINGYDPSFSVPLIVRDTLNEVDNFTDQDNEFMFVPALWLNDLYSVFHNVYPHEQYQEYIGHGTRVLSYLLEHNPEAEFVIAKSPDFFGLHKQLFCNPELIEDGYTETNLQRLEVKIADASRDFKDNIIHNLGVNYINYSGGYTLDSVKGSWQNNCSNDLPTQELQVALLDTIKPFYQALFNSDGVLGIQASGINMNENNNALDIDKNYVNRILVGDFSTLNSELLADGSLSGKPPTLENNRDNSKKWIDIFVNFGIGLSRPFPYNDTPVMETGALGLDSLPTTSMQPSWAAPVALSRAIHIKNSEYPDMILDNLVIQNIRNIMTPEVCDYTNWELDEYNRKCKMQDPLLWRQHEIYRLGYLQ